MRVKLMVFRDGRAILALPQDGVSQAQIAELREYWRRFIAQESDLLVVTGEVRYIDMDLSQDGLHIIEESDSGSSDTPEEGGNGGDQPTFSDQLRRRGNRGAGNLSN